MQFKVATKKRPHTETIQFDTTLPDYHKIEIFLEIDTEIGTYKLTNKDKAQLKEAIRDSTKNIANWKE